jgi:hypothetical protein
MVTPGGFVQFTSSFLLLSPFIQLSEKIILVMIRIERIKIREQVGGKVIVGDCIQIDSWKIYLFCFGSYSIVEHVFF